MHTLHVHTKQIKEILIIIMYVLKEWQHSVCFLKTMQPYSIMLLVFLYNMELAIYNIVYNTCIGIYLHRNP